MSECFFFYYEGACAIFSDACSFVALVLPEPPPDELHLFGPAFQVMIRFLRTHILDLGILSKDFHL